MNLNLRRNLPIGGIVAFSLCSVWSLYHLLASNAKHQTPLFWLPAVLVELVTAWAVYQSVEMARRVLKSNISKQDRRFYTLILAMFLAVAVPTLSASVVANTLEFGGNVLLGLLFPIASIGCAVGVALPDTMTTYERKKQDERKAKQAEVKRLKEERKAAQQRRKKLSSLGNAQATFEQLVANPAQTQATIAQELSITRQAVGNHMAKLEQAGAIRRNNGGAVEILWEV